MINEKQETVTDEVAVSKMETTTPTREKSSAVGNAAAMRDALLIVKRLFDGRLMWQPDIRKAHEAINAALAKPPRNCDKQLPAKRVSSDDVEQAWLVFKRRDPNVYFDVPGLLRFIVWLFDEAKGEAHEQK